MLFLSVDEKEEIKLKIKQLKDQYEYLYDEKYDD
jgi:hypothetical protein